MLFLLFVYYLHAIIINAKVVEKFQLWAFCLTAFVLAQQKVIFTLQLFWKSHFAMCALLPLPHPHLQCVTVCLCAGSGFLCSCIFSFLTFVATVLDKCSCRSFVSHVVAFFFFLPICLFAFDALTFWHNVWAIKYQRNKAKNKSVVKENKAQRENGKAVKS